MHFNRLNHAVKERTLISTVLHGTVGEFCLVFAILDNVKSNIVKTTITILSQTIIYIAQPYSKASDIPVVPVS